MKDCRRVPMRTCLGCGKADQQPSLIRVVRDSAGGLAVDAERRAGGRGGYLHRAPECWTRFAQRKGPVRSFRAAVDRPARAALIAQLRNSADE